MNNKRSQLGILIDFLAKNDPLFDHPPGPVAVGHEISLQILKYGYETGSLSCQIDPYPYLLISLVNNIKAIIQLENKLQNEGFFVDKSILLKESLETAQELLDLSHNPNN